MKMKTKRAWRSVISCVLAFILFALVLISFAAALFGIKMAFSESAEPNAWILRRQTTDNVLIQKQPGKQPYEYWRLVDNDPPTAADLMLTGNQSGKWVECVCSYLPGSPTGWVQEGFVVADKPQEYGQIAKVVKSCYAQESIGGRESQWLTAGDYVKVLYRSENWCTTIYGMVSTDALDFNCKASCAYVRALRWSDWTRLDHLINIVDRW